MVYLTLSDTVHISARIRERKVWTEIAVLIPCYNESKTIEKVVKGFKAALPEAVIYVYDNNSTDGTDEIARKGRMRLSV